MKFPVLAGLNLVAVQLALFAGMKSFGLMVLYHHLKCVV